MRDRQPLVQAALVVAVLAATGAVSGIVWEWLWSPGTGVVVDHRWVALNAIELQHQFSGTGWYVVVGLVAGLLAGIVVALLCDRAPLVTLVALLVGAALGAWLMVLVGEALGPDDPDSLARTAAQGTKLPAALSVTGRSPELALPVGSLLGLTMVFIGLSDRRRHPDHQSADEDTADREQAH